MVGRKCKADVVLQMAKGVVLELAVVAITEVVGMSHVCGWAAGGGQVGASLVTRLWPTLDQPLAHSGPSLGHINGTATIYARRILGPCMAHY